MCAVTRDDVLKRAAAIGVKAPSVDHMEWATQLLAQRGSSFDPGQMVVWLAYWLEIAQTRGRNLALEAIIEKAEQHSDNLRGFIDLCRTTME